MRKKMLKEILEMMAGHPGTSYFFLTGNAIEAVLRNATPAWEKLVVLVSLENDVIRMATRANIRIILSKHPNETVEHLDSLWLTEEDAGPLVPVIRAFVETPLRARLGVEHEECRNLATIYATVKLDG